MNPKSKMGFINKLKRFNKYRFFKITYFTLIVFILEVVFFHVFNYIHDYFNATLIISYVVLGIGLGAFISSKVKISEKYLFILCSLGTIFSLYIAVIKTVFYTSIGISNFILSLVFLFPAIYISRAYTEHKSNQIYLFDMAGCFLGVVLVVLFYKFFVSETIFLLVLLIIPLVNLIDILCQKLEHKKAFAFVFFVFLIPGLVLLCQQVGVDKHNLFGIINCKDIEESPEGTIKIFCRDWPLIKSYDNLMGRIDITRGKLGTSSSYTVSYNGWPNDVFHKRMISTSDDYSKYKGEQWPTLDIRFLYGAIQKPKILIIGSSAQGAVKTLKRITPVENITTVEINPAIFKIMQKDFFEESGRAYSGLDPIYGNGISFLKSTSQKFDMITLLNTHSYRNLAHNGSPDYLHTTETYNLLFNHLTEKGYLMFEERPEAPNSRLALYREINTLWQTLKKRDVENPSSHFIIWSWDNNNDYKKYSLHYYVGMVVTKDPIDKKLMEPWIKEELSGRPTFFHLEYFTNYKKELSSSEFTELFEIIEANDFSSLEKENFDSSIATNNRPFLSQATLTNKKLNKLVLNIGILTLVLWVIFTIPLIKSSKRKATLFMNLYYILIGFAFFFIEIILFQVYQNVFLSPSASFIFVLGTLLLFSGIGGYFSDRFNLKKTIMFLIPASLLALYIPDWLLSLGMPLLLIKISALILISITGFLMGLYFPKGLNFAKKNGLKDKIYYLFAINAIAACFATVFALYLGIKIGYIYTIIIALLFYLLASFVLELYNVRESYVVKN